MARSGKVDHLLIILLCCITLVTTTREPVEHQVVIVGAGASGFATASTLLQHGVSDVLVLEAADRIGGRINTIKFDGAIFDMGAEFVHGEKDNIVYEMVGSFNLLESYSHLQQPEMFLFVNTSGNIFNSQDIKAIIDDGVDILADEDTKNFYGSLGDFFYPRFDKYLKAKSVDSYTSEALRYYIPLLEGVDSAVDNLSEIGCKGDSEYMENEGDLELKWKKNGYDIIFDFLSKKLPNPTEELPVRQKIVLGKKVILIEYNQPDDKVKISCEDGSSYLAQHAVVTISLGVLKKHAAEMFSPPLPKDKATAIQTIGFGCVGKVFMLFPKRWWPKNINNIVPLFSEEELNHFRTHTKHGYWTSHMTGYYPVMNHDRMLCVWFAGKACETMETLTDREVTDGLMEMLHILVGNKYKLIKPDSILKSGWRHNPLTLGSYSIPSVESDLLKVDSSDIASPLITGCGKPVVMFAGEATHPHYFATVHGAISSGQREAYRLIDYLKGKSK